MAKNIIQMQLITYQTNINTQIIIIIINKQTKNKNKNRISSFFNFPNSFSHETKSWFEQYYNNKKLF